MRGDPSDDVVRSFYRMRQALGYLGLLLPVTLILGGLVSLGRVEPSISDYYHTLLRDVFVATLAAIGVFLISYRGYARTPGERISDDQVTTVAGMAALGVAFLPNATGGGPASFSQDLLGMRGAAAGHYLSAIVFLSCLGWLSLVRFARTKDARRRRIYLACGWVIVAMTAATIAASWFKVRGPAGPQAVVNGWRLVLWFEAIAVAAFAVSWLVKGRADMVLSAGFWRRRGRG
ncbi:MAG: hypothetical protein N2422_04850 [Rhodobacteraceae bacterium]|nr:hypothetical protein [Paracoccaceae bacterium]